MAKIKFITSLSICSLATAAFLMLKLYYADNTQSIERMSAIVQTEEHIGKEKIELNTSMQDVNLLLDQVIQDKISEIKKNDRVSHFNVLSDINDHWGSPIELYLNVLLADRDTSHCKNKRTKYERESCVKRVNKQKDKAVLRAVSYGEDRIKGTDDDILKDKAFPLYKKISKGVYSVVPHICEDLTKGQKNTIRVFNSSGFSVDKCKSTLHRLSRRDSLFVNSKKHELTDLLPIGELTNLKELRFRNLSVQHLNDLGKLKNLTHLSIQHAPELKDISVLKTMEKLERLRLDNTSISDLSPLSELKDLQELHIKSSVTYDVTPISMLTQLNRLTISNAKITNIKPLKNMNALEYLTITETALSNIEDLKYLTKLKRLELIGLATSDNIVLTHLNKLERLTLHSSDLLDISPLSNITDLKELKIKASTVENLNSLKNLTKLSTLHIVSEQVSSFDLVKNITSLFDFQVNGTQITDLKSLKERARFKKDIKLLSLNDSSQASKQHMFYASSRTTYLSDKSKFLQTGEKVWLSSNGAYLEVEIVQHETQQYCHKITVSSADKPIPKGVLLLTEQPLPQSYIEIIQDVPQVIRDSALQVYRDHSYYSQRCSWYKPDMKVQEMPNKDQVTIDMFDSKGVTYAVIGYPSCEPAEYDERASALVKINQADDFEFISKVAGPPALDVNGDGFPEFLGSYYEANYGNFLTAPDDYQREIASNFCWF